MKVYNLKEAPNENILYFIYLDLLNLIWVIIHLL